LYTGVLGAAPVRIALIDGAIDTAHPAFRDCRIYQFGNSGSHAASKHATFNASILLGNRDERTSGRLMAMCPECTLLNYAVVTDAMLTGNVAVRMVAEELAKVVELATRAKCQVIVFGVQIHQADSRHWEPLRESLRSALAANSAVIIPVGNRKGAGAVNACTWPEVIITASLGWRGTMSAFSNRTNTNTIFAPGEEIPGAGPASGYMTLSGTSFAATIAAGAFARARSLFPDRSLAEIVAELCPLPNRMLNGSRLFARNFCFRTEDYHAAADTRFLVN
jgi:subtilisin family serine protease